MIKVQLEKLGLVKGLLNTMVKETTRKFVYILSILYCSVFLVAVTKNGDYLFLLLLLFLMK